MVTREMFEKRLVELQGQKQRALFTLSAIDGAIQECDSWIAHIAAEEGKKDSVEINVNGKAEGPILGVLNLDHI